MPNQYDAVQLESLLKEIIDERRPPEVQKNQVQDQTQSQDRPNAKNRTPWFGLDDDQLKEYTNRVSEQLGVIQDIDLTIAKSVAAESEEAEGLNITKRREYIQSLVGKLESSSEPLSAAEQVYLAERHSELGHLKELQERFTESEQHSKAERKDTELNQPNMKFSGLSMGDTDKVRVYMAVVAPTDEGSRFKDLKLQNGQVAALSDQLWIGVGTPYKALAWLQKYQLDNNRGNAEARKEDRVPVIRSIEVNRQFVEEWLEKAVPEGGKSHEEDNGSQQPQLMYVDVKTPNQFGLKTSVATFTSNRGGPMVLKNVEGQQSKLLKSLLDHADPKSLETISFKHNLHLRNTAVDGTHVDLNKFMENLGYRANQDGPAVRLLGKDATIFHTKSDKSWGFSTHSEQMVKVHRMNSFFDALQQTAGRSQVLSHTRQTSDSASSLGYDSDSGRSSLDGSTSSRDSDSESVRSHASSTEDWTKIPVGKVLGQFERSILKQQLAELLEVNHLTPGALVTPAPSLTSHEQRDKHGNNQVRALVESAIAYQIMGDASLDRKEITASLKKRILQEDTEEFKKRFDKWVNGQAELVKKQSKPAAELEDKEVDGWLDKDGKLRYPLLEPAQIATALTNYLRNECGYEKAGKTVDEWLTSLEKLDEIEKALNKGKAAGTDVGQILEEVDRRQKKVEETTANIERLGSTLRDNVHTSLMAEKLLQNKMIQNDLLALKGVGNEINAKVLFEELENFANAKDDKSMRVGGNLFCHCLRIVAQDINEGKKIDLKFEPHPEMTPQGQKTPELIVNNREERIDYSALLNQTAQANGLPFDKMRSSAAFTPAFTEGNKIASNYMGERDLPFTGGISGTTRDIIQALPALETAGGQALSDKARKSLILINAAFMVENQYHSMFEALYPAARRDIGGVGNELLAEFDKGHARDSNTALYQRALQTMTGSNDIWRGAMEQLDKKLGQAIEPAVVKQGDVTIPKHTGGKLFKVDEVRYDEGVVICSYDPAQSRVDKAYAPIRDFGSSPKVTEKNGHGHVVYPYSQDLRDGRMRTKEEKDQVPTLKQSKAVKRG
ncbi:hypothetical protein FNU76_17240 [Chitinimonas arctica]|uniref:Uncharacterized protein n=1 Tax=Chitinimonas arctica TaxID=2594795 RepID=A0A516SIS9_9NEIS|nr:hypothetical protein [Chitinimonas arctica]QDQ27948.1 hypothetical protein FNU76_17240 [Chitinimonas arctica]